MKSLGEIFARLRAGRDREALEKAEEERYDTPAERRIAEEDFEAKKDDLHVKEYLPGVDDDL
jgi:hypothetical protein